MMRGVFTILAFISTVLFPWPLAALLALSLALYEPLAPLAIGIFADTLYYSPQSGIPFLALSGLLVTIVAFLVRSRLKPGIIEG